MKKKGLIIFDMDGTLYKFKEGSFNASGLREKIIENAENFISRSLSISKIEAKKILGIIERKYGEDISLALEKEYGINRYDYFKDVWDISAKGLIKKNNKLKKYLAEITKNFDFILVSDAPMIWVDSVLRELKIDDYFEGRIFSGEGSRRKGFGNVFEYLAKKCKFSINKCVVVGDQEKTDIIPAKKCEMRAVLIGKNKGNSIADCIISNVEDLSEELIEKLIKKRA